MAAIAFVKNVASKAQGNSATNVLTVPAAGVALGNFLVVRVAITTNSAGVGVTSIADTGGNTYTPQTNVESGNHRSEFIYSAPITTALVSGNTITVTFPSMITSGVVVDEWSGLTNTTDGTPASNSSSGTTPSQAITTTVAACLVVSHILIEVGSADGFTPDAEFAELTTVTSATNYIQRGGYWITTVAATETYNPTLGTSRTYSVGIMAKEGTDQAAPSAFPFKSEAGATLKRL